MKTILLILSALFLIITFSKAQFLAYTAGNLKKPTAYKYIGATNKISQLQNTENIENFIQTLDKRYSNFKVDAAFMNDEKKCSDLYTAAKPESWQTGDLDNNGYSDFLVIGTVSGAPVMICVVDTGYNNYVIKKINRRIFEDCSYPTLKTVNGESAICYYHYDYSANKEVKKSQASIEIDTLTYKFGDLVELNSNIQNHKIEKIEYSTSACFGACPVFSITIDAGGIALFFGTKFNRRNGQFKTQINEDNFKELTGLLNYINFPELKNKYAVSWSDDQTSILTITFDGGKTKTISDYGLVGTFGLNRVYDLIFKLRDNQQWR